MATDFKTDVIIVGGGPVGLFMAAELSFWGVNCTVIEKRTTTSNSARAVLINANTMEHMRRLGLERPLLESSYPRNQPVSLTMGVSLLGDAPLISSSFASWGDAIDGLGDEGTVLGFTKEDAALPSILCPQYEQERVLKAHLETKSNVKLLWGKMATSVQDSGEEVTVNVMDIQDPAVETTITAKYLIACDGGRSWVRKQMEVHNVGQFVVKRACSFVINSPEMARQLQETGRLGLGALFTKRYTSVSIALNTKGDFAFHVMLLPSTPDKVMSEMCKNAKEHVRYLIGRDDVPFTVVDAHEYNMHGLMATKYRVGRVFFAGDAAHQWLPAGGLGLNTGYQDASDLGWKMGAVINGWGGQSLLDSFQIERRPIADKTRRFALSIAPSNISVGLQFIIGTFLKKSPAPRLLLYIFGKKLINMALELNKDVVLGNQYAESNIVLHEFQDEDNTMLKTPADGKVGKFSRSCLPGTRAPHVVLPESTSIHDIFGRGFILLIIGGQETDCEELQALLKARKVPFEVHVYPKLPEFIELYDCKFYLIRPDGIIAWRSYSQPSNHQSHIIVHTICGDMPFRPLTKPSSSSEPTFSLSFLKNIAYGVLAGMFLKERTSVSDIGAIGVGLGVATLMSFGGRGKSEVFPQWVSRHQAWETIKFGSSQDSLVLENKFIRPFGPNDILIKVHAASLNPVDITIRRGYTTNKLKNLARKDKRSSIFPIVLGRDCSGEVVVVGDNTHMFKPGDLVYASCPVSLYGTHAQYACIDQKYVSLKPINVDHSQAASLPWVAMATWTAVVKQAGLTEQSTRCKKVLVHGGSGGVGSFAIQLLRSWGAEVTTTCSKDNLQFVHGLGADKAIDYKNCDFAEVLKKRSYDFVLDTVGTSGNYENRSLSLLKLYGNANYTTLASPRNLLCNKFGPFLGGFLFQWYYRYKIFVNRIFGGRGFYYAYAEPDGEALSRVKEMVEVGDIRPCVSSVYSKDEMIDAHQHLESGSPFGKVVVSFV